MHFDYHPWMLLVTPLVGVSCGTCDDPACDSEHWRISAGWLLWSVHFDIST